MKPLRLSAQEREFFTLVTRAAFANPFGEERAQLDRTIAGTPADGHPLPQALLPTAN